MREEELYETIRERGALESTEAARDAAEATLETLGERITKGEAEDLADGLPDELAGAVAGPGGEAEAFGADEFVDRVSDREEEADPEAAIRHIEATLETVGDRTNRDEWREVRRQLPDEYAGLYEVGTGGLES